jgi:hypothetical protein
VRRYDDAVAIAAGDVALVLVRQDEEKVSWFHQVLRCSRPAMVPAAIRYDKVKKLVEP